MRTKLSVSWCPTAAPAEPVGPAARAALLCLTICVCQGCGPAGRPEVRYVALGDSITGTLESDTWPRFLVELLGISGEAFAAEGSGGRTASEGLQRLREIVELDIYPNAEIFIYFLGGPPWRKAFWSGN